MLWKSSCRCVVHIGVLNEPDMVGCLFRQYAPFHNSNKPHMFIKNPHMSVWVCFYVRACVREYVRQCLRAFDLVSEIIDRDVHCKKMSLRH